MTDFSADAYLARAAIVDCANQIQAEWTRPSAIYKPAVYPDGNQWCALYGEDLATGVAGFGSTPDEACRDFDRAWREEAPPPVRAAVRA